MDIICFHNPDEDNGYLSNWYPSSFTVDGVAFSSMEQFMMYRKAICFGDEAVAAQILSTSDVAKIKSLGRQVSNYDESMWNGIRQIVVYEGLLAKFSQNEELKGKLKATENAVLAECAVKDCIWGIGLSMKDPDRLNKAKWNGQNLLGYALMMVRERLQQDYSWEQRKLWELTIWDKKFNEVEAEKQPKIIKYPYVLADVFSKIEDASGDVRLLSTGNYIGYTTDEKAGKNLCVGEVVAIPWGGVPNIKYYKGKFVTADNRIATSNDTETLGNRFLSLYLEHNLAFLQSIYRGASIKHPSMNDVLSMQISIPHIQEQREIETWFANLDNLITLHQRELYKHLRYRILKVRRKS